MSKWFVVRKPSLGEIIATSKLPHKPIRLWPQKLKFLGGTKMSSDWLKGVWV